MIIKTSKHTNSKRSRVVNYHLYQQNRIIQFRSPKSDRNQIYVDYHLAVKRNFMPKQGLLITINLSPSY